MFRRSEFDTPTCSLDLNRKGSGVPGKGLLCKGAPSGAVFAVLP